MRMIVGGPLLALLVAAGLAQSADSMPADTASATAFDDAVAANDAADEAATQAWRAYQAKIRATLRASNSPRDWALAAKFTIDDETEALSRAAEAVPDDALVQWLVTISDKRDNAASRTMANTAAKRLVKLEPDNGAAWLLVLVSAHQRDDGAVVRDALARMSASDRFDMHFGDVLHAWLAFYDRNPPDEFVSNLADQEGWEGFSPVFVAAMAANSAIAMPAFQALLKACEDAEASADIRLSCRDAGRLVLHEGNTLIARKVGIGLLRKLGGGGLSDTDPAMQRELDWYSWQGAAHAMGSSEANRQWNTAFEASWRDQSSEIVAIERTLKQLGIASKPPAGWTMPKNSSLAADS